MAIMDRLIQLFTSYEVTEFLLPFLLIFVILYAVTATVPILKENRFRVIVSLVFSLLVVIPHITGGYPSGYDPIDIINETFPSIALMAVAIVMLFILLGVFGLGYSKSKGWLNFLVGIASIGFIIYIFGASLEWWQGPYDIFYWWTEEVTELAIIILVFGLVVWFITRESGEDGGLLKALGKIGGKLNEGFKEATEKEKKE